MERTEQINIKVSLSIKDLTRAIAEYEGLRTPELVRGWIVAKIAEYRKDKCFMRELEKGHLKTVEQLQAEHEDKGQFEEENGLRKVGKDDEDLQ